MSKKVHLNRSDRSTWCGRPIWNKMHTGRLATTRDHTVADCKTCLKANTAEQRKEDAASA